MQVSNMLYSNFKFANAILYYYTYAVTIDKLAYASQHAYAHAETLTCIIMVLSHTPEVSCGEQRSVSELYTSCTYKRETNLICSIRRRH